MEVKKLERKIKRLESLVLALSLPTAKICINCQTKPRSIQEMDLINDTDNCVDCTNFDYLDGDNHE